MAGRIRPPTRLAAAWVGPQEIDDPQKFGPKTAGSYALSFSGQGNVSVNGPATLQGMQYDQAGNTTHGTLVVPAGMASTDNVVVLTFTGTKRTENAAAGSGFTNLRVIRPGYAANSTQLFDNTFLRTLNAANFSTLRFMGWTNTNNTNKEYPAHREWAERKLPTDATQDDWGNRASGGSWEDAIALANAVRKDPWINVPVDASDDYVRNLATLVKTKLDPSLHVNVEYSNEIWNWSFTQSQWNLASAKAQGLDYISAYAEREAEIAKLFGSVFGTGALNSRVRVINAWQLGWDPPDAQIDEQMQYIADHFGDPSTLLWAVAVAPYMNCQSVCATGSAQDILNAFRASSDASVPARKKVLGVAQKWKLAGGMVAYEGGTDTGGGDKTNVANKIAAERSPALKDILVRDLRVNWINIGGGEFTYLEIVSGYNRYGSWGLTDDVSNPDRNAKFAAVREVIGDGSAPTADPGNPPANPGSPPPDPGTPPADPPTTQPTHPTQPPVATPPRPSWWQWLVRCLRNPAACPAS